MKLATIQTVVTLLVCFVLPLSIVACQANLSDEDIDRIVSKQAEVPISEEDMSRLVDALMANSKYQEYLEDDEWIEDFTKAMMEHHLMETTAEEECGTVILMATVMMGDYTTLPTGSEVDTLCAWYLENTMAE